MTTACDAELKSCCAGLYELPITRLILGDTFHPGGAALTRQLASAALVSRQTRVLDVASGTGETARLLASHFGCEVVGVDLSPVNVALATELSRQAGISRVRFVTGDAESLPFYDAQFDVAVCECALCSFPSQAAALAEMRRVLVPRGRLALSDVVLNAPIPPVLDTVLGRALCISGALSVEGYLAALANAGFTLTRHRDASESLRRMIDGIEARIAHIRKLAGAGAVEWPAAIDDSGPTVRAARRFVAAGGLGYALFIARS